MSDPEWFIRSARASDRARLRTFTCAQPGVPWEEEVEAYIRNALWQWASDPHAKSNDPRLLLLLERATGRLLGVTAHEMTRLVGPDKKEFAATKLEVVALSRDWQGRRFGSGERASDVLFSAILKDIADRVPPRYARVFAIVHEKNERSLKVCRRHGFTEEMDRNPMSPSYRRLLTAHKGT